MAGGRHLADEYERRFPGTGCPEGQKQERMERILYREDRPVRSRRSRSIIVPRLPWRDEKEVEA